MAPGEHSRWSPNWSGPILPCSALSWVRPLRKNSKAFALMELHPESQHPSGYGGGQASGLSLSPFSHDAPPGSTDIPDRPAEATSWVLYLYAGGKDAQTLLGNCGRSQRWQGAGAHVQMPTQVGWAMKEASKLHSQHKHSILHIDV